MALRDHSERAAAGPVAQMAEALGILCGVYLAASPWIVGFNGFTTLRVNNLITGLAIALLLGGLGSAAYERTHAMSWAALCLGAWTIVAPWVVSGAVDTTRTITSNVIVGGVTCLAALALAAMGVAGRRRRV
jgi:SPW repeat-containing protein